MHINVYSNPIIPACIAWSPHYCSSEPVLIIQLWEAWWSDTVTPCGRLAANTNRRLWRWAASTEGQVTHPHITNGIKPNWGTATIPARQLSVVTTGKIKRKDVFCVCVFSEWNYHDLHINPNVHATSPRGPEKSQNPLHSCAIETQSGHVQVQVLRPSKPLIFHFWESDLLRAQTHTHTQSTISLFFWPNIIRNPATTET